MWGKCKFQMDLNCLHFDLFKFFWQLDNSMCFKNIFGAFHWNQFGRYIWPDVDVTWSLTKCQTDLKPYPGGVHLNWCWPDLKSDQMSTWCEASSGGVLLTSLTKCKPDLKNHPGGYIWLVCDLITHLGQGFKSNLPPHLHINSKKKTNDLSKYTHYFPVQFSTTNITLIMVPWLLVNN